MQIDTQQSIPPSVPVMDPETLELLARQNAVQKELLRLNRDCGIAFYRPHHYQHLFHSSTKKRRGLFAGNRFGKSQCGAAETAAWMLGERPWYKVPFPIYGVDYLPGGKNRTRVIKSHHAGHEDHPLVRSGIPSYPTKQLIVCTNWKKVEEIWTSQDAERPGKIWQFLPKGWAKGYTNHEGVISDIYGKNGSYLAFMSADAFRRNKLTVESSDWDRVAFDEPAPLKLWKGAARGLVDRNGQSDFTLTSLEEMWIYDAFSDDSPQDKTDEDSIVFHPDIRDSFRATMYDNPHLTDEGIQNYLSTLSEDEISCRADGLPLELSGLIYKEFRRDIHILKSIPGDWRDFHYPSKTSILYIRVDTHPVKPHAVSYYVVGPAEIPIQCNETWLACDADTLAETINKYIADSGLFLGGIKVEPAAWIKDASTRNIAIASTLRRHGLPVRPASKDLSNGILQVRSALKRAKFFITPNCTNTLREFSRYRYDPETGKPVDQNDHFMENLYRLIIDSPRWYDPDTAASFPIPDEEFLSSDLSVSSLA